MSRRGDNLRWTTRTVSGWRDIVAVAAGAAWHTVGLKSDGTVVATGYEDGQKPVRREQLDGISLLSRRAQSHYTVGSEIGRNGRCSGNCAAR